MSGECLIYYVGQDRWEALVPANLRCDLIHDYIRRRCPMTVGNRPLFTEGRFPFMGAELDRLIITLKRE